MSTTVAEMLVETLHTIGVRQIFGVVGDALNPFTEAVRKDKRIEWIGVRHEEGAALAAAGQGKLTGKLAVCCGTTGPGANHLVAGLYEARKDHAPVLAISGGVPASRRGIDYLQENNPDLLFRDVAAYTQTIIDPAQAVQVVHQAIAQAYHQRGVAHLSIPADVIGAKLPGPAVVASLNTLRPQPEVTPPESEIAHAAQLINAAKSVAIFVGNGARSSINDIAVLAEKLQAPVVHTFRAKDMLPYDHPHWIGGVGLIGGAPGMDAMRDAELLLMLGTDYPYSEFLPTRTQTVQIDERGFVLGRRMPVDLGITGSVGPAVTQLLQQVQGKTDTAFLRKVGEHRKQWNETLDKHAVMPADPDKGPIKPQYLARRLSDRAAEDAVFVVDTGVVTLWCGNWIRQSGRQRLLASFNNAAVGTSLGQGNGIQALDRKRQVIVAAGDGGFTMLLGEFMTAVEHKLPVKVVVFNNREWGLVHLEMEEAGLPAFEGAEFPNLDFALFAGACGAQGFTAKTPAQLEEVLGPFLAAPGPAILNVFINPSELPIMPHIKLDQIWHFGMAKIKEAMISMGGAG
ncbi:MULTISPECIES: thiamine pyrophosphate-binding protein [unclassified Herbaspirillum]|uniref:thiamine pyrophosphate-binding protein n=1 Tax=unclassified Herbaspirillum TaxID=2624150 RepID=UPI000E2E879D|nr:MULTISPECIES: thiamine pyrophosphate-binding protein [unclassified Herbaspirillum]RFB73139.1 pyruvate dehydrogenase [Herbaspirillum sp. 3R-3a1]TFI11052.1 pyruvate dehydrogenase [Herbaspirillum sp. 3R11]TFI16959.1 pyruvate dehydrogenase [Herbaspirillum sp. 3R-11]TFI30971.1 pyruvate dehydrogenase [Herbaspirillum sp. 3C11]